MAPTSCTPGFNWDGTRKGTPTTRTLRIDPNSPTRLLRSAAASTCRFCGNHIEWCYRTDGSPVPLHPAELAATNVPPPKRWHLASGIAHPGGSGSSWCRIAHTALCPANSPHTGATTPTLTELRRTLALNTRHLANNGFQPAARGSTTPKTDPAQIEPAPPQRPIVHMLHTHYLAPGPLPHTRCVAQTRTRDRCRNPVTDHSEGRWTLMPVEPAGTAPRHLATHLLPTEMAVYYLSDLPYSVQLRWRRQRCAVHDYGTAADIAVTEWEPFDPFLHHTHIHSRIPTEPPTPHPHTPGSA
ncbi:DUF6083 domain-containing protein [Kitasatospora griseola]|uniref:DUF6083 domain-containing protein n=1 Tax=Kitasatospora griseola TaxID=2064 RepID=UPI0036651CEC